MAEKDAGAKGWVAVALLLVPGACSSKSIDTRAESGASTAADCGQKYSTSDGYGYGDSSDLAVAPPSNADAGPVAPPLGPEVAASRDCANGRAAPDDPAACVAANFMSVEAALCIARANSLAEGQTGLSGSLIYNYKLRRVIYSVRNTLHKEADKSDGESISIDAITGAVLERGGWGSVS